MRKTIIDKRHLSKPRGIVVHPLEGYLFWTDWSKKKAAISRSNLDGTDIRVLFTSPQVIWPNGITIDFIAERVYWVDASKDYIASCDLNGKSFKKVLEQDNRVAHPFAVGVYKDLMYWDDWKMNSVFSADKDHGIMIRTLANNMPSLMDLKVYAHSIQTGKNACSEPNKCSQFCVGAPHGSYTCMCSDEMEITANGECLCPGSQLPYTNKTCPQIGDICLSGFFTCANKKCLSSTYRCDGENDCGDNSDEENCSPNRASCSEDAFTCVSDGKCIPGYYKCDHDKDCLDGSDEHACNFDPCKDNEYKCGNGICITRKWLCDGEDDCRDFSDEADCGKGNTTVVCKPEEFQCTGNGQCISAMWRCDYDPDCADGSDEENCDQKECDPSMFNCGNGRCIFRLWKCDGDRDCENGADEANCPTIPTYLPSQPTVPVLTCHDWMFKCANERCVPYWWKCDKIDDCGDGSDEMGCPHLNESTVVTTTVRPATDNCESYHFLCDSGLCLNKSFVCDGDNDCPGGEDEKDCPAADSCEGKFK